MTEQLQSKPDKAPLKKQQEYKEQVNLYEVAPISFAESDWVCFAFAASRNRARIMLQNEGLSDDEYIYSRARLVRKDVGGDQEFCVDTCERLEACGVTEVCSECGKPFPRIGSCSCGCDWPVWQIDRSTNE